MILHPGDPPADRHAVDVHVHRRQEDADLLPVARRAWPRPSGSPATMTRPSAGETTADGGAL